MAEMDLIVLSFLAEMKIHLLKRNFLRKKSALFPCNVVIILSWIVHFVRTWCRAFNPLSTDPDFSYIKMQ